LKIYTKTGDKGETALFGGKRVPKDDPRIQAYGTVDELNSVIGMARSFNENKILDLVLSEIQNQLFVLGADLATPSDVKSPATKRIVVRDYTTLEGIIDDFEGKMAPLNSFILPGGAKAASFLHNARTVCRRAERLVFALRKKDEASEEALIFLNRLSDLLFVLARYVNKIAGVKDIPWKQRTDSDRRA
jgi:cob(I)alamin adenosyltransferase